MSGNRFGTLFQYTTWGESHGPAIGCVIDGVPPRIPLEAADIQRFLDRRRPGQSRFTTQRREPDAVQILSGVYEGLTLGTPIALMIENVDARSKDYTAIETTYRPGHADYTYDQKYGHRDPRGGGRSSARETACRVAAGAVARRILVHQIGDDVDIAGGVVQIGPHAALPERYAWDAVHDNPFFSPDPLIVPVWEDYLDQIRKEGSSAGALIEVRARGIPPGLGAPVIDKLDADIAKAMMSINAVKGVEIGAGMDSVTLRGEENADPLRADAQGRVHFIGNKAGGILGGISSGQEIIVRVAFKPTSSILSPVETITRSGENTEIITKGRHDPCVGIRGTPVVEAMLASVLADHWLRHKAQCL